VGGGFTFLGGGLLELCAAGVRGEDAAHRAVAAAIAVAVAVRLGAVCKKEVSQSLYKEMMTNY